MGSFVLKPGELDNKHDPLRLGQIADARNPVITTLVQAQNADFDDNGLGTRRNGRTQIYSGTPHSYFSPFPRAPIGYFVDASVLKRLNPDYTTTTVTTLQNNLTLVHEVINDEIVISNTGDIGWLSGTQFTAFSPTLRDEFELAMPAGQCLAFDHGDGCLLVASGSVVFRSKPYDAEVRDARFSEFPMNGYIRMLATVEDGWWVATEKHVGFVARDGADEFTYRHITDNVPPYNCFRAGWEDTDSGRRRYVIWAGPDGFCEGRAGGQFRFLSTSVALPTGSAGTLIARTLNGIDQYIAVIRDPEGAESFTAPTLNINSIRV